MPFPGCVSSDQTALQRGAGGLGHEWPGPQLLEAAVIGVPDDHWGESVHAIVVVRPGETLTGDEVIEFCRQRLASYKKPAAVEFVDELPRNASGKILKRELRAPYWKDAGRSI